MVYWRSRQSTLYKVSSSFPLYSLIIFFEDKFEYITFFQTHPQSKELLRIDRVHTESIYVVHGKHDEHNQNHTNLQTNTQTLTHTHDPHLLLSHNIIIIIIIILHVVQFSYEFFFVYTQTMLQTVHIFLNVYCMDASVLNSQFTPCILYVYRQRQRHSHQFQFWFKWI